MKLYCVLFVFLASLPGTLANSGHGHAKDYTIYWYELTWFANWTLEERTDHLLFGTTIQHWYRNATHRDPKQLLWDKHNPGSHCRGGFFDNYKWMPFRTPCWRHTFGYMNYRNQNRFTADNRRKIDDNLLADLNWACFGDPTVNYKSPPHDTDINSVDYKTCKRLVRSYYQYVREKGREWYGEQDRPLRKVWSDGGMKWRYVEEVQFDAEDAEATEDFKLIDFDEPDNSTSSSVLWTPKTLTTEASAGTTSRV